jgi:hypothetical protein
MKKLIICVSAVVVTGLIGGCVPITYQKTVTTHLDANGHVTGTDIIETISEPHQEMPRFQSTTNDMKLNYIQQ